MDKGNQIKYFDNGYWYKYDNYYGEAIAEVLVSEFLAACNEDNYVEYKLYDGYNCVVSKSFLPVGYTFLTFAEMVLRLGYTYNSWYSRYYKSCSSKERYENVISIFWSYGLKTVEIENYFKRMLTLDYIFRNPDRHLSNFGIIVNDETREVVFAPIFDNGLSLGVAIGGYDVYKKALLSKVGSFKPFSMQRKRNVEVVDNLYEFKFDVMKFIETHDNRIGIESIFFRVFLEILSTTYVVDINGIDVRSILEVTYGDWNKYKF